MCSRMVGIFVDGTAGDFDNFVHDFHTHNDLFFGNFERFFVLEIGGKGLDGFEDDLENVWDEGGDVSNFSI